MRFLPAETKLFHEGPPHHEVRKLTKPVHLDIDHAPVFTYAEVPVENSVSELGRILERFFREFRYQQNNCLIHAIAEAADIALTQQVINAIRNQLAQVGVPIGNFIQSNQQNVRIIMRSLGIHGLLYVHNVENPDHVALPIYVFPSQQSQNVTLTINYSTLHFYASPG